jgi:serine protein kinase
MSTQDFLASYTRRFEDNKAEEMSLDEYLELCKKDPTAYANPAERLLMAIGEPEMMDTRHDPVLSRIFSNKVIPRYSVFGDFYGMEEPIEQIVGFLKHAAQGLEETKQVLYLLGPVGGGKSSLAEKLKDLMQKTPFYAIKDSPVFDSPLSLFNPEEDAPLLEERFNIPSRYLRYVMSPWAIKRLNEFNGDINKFRVIKVKPSRMPKLNQGMKTIKTSPH